MTPPKIVEKYDNVNTQEGEEVVLRVRLTGTQPIAVTWMRDETPLKSDKRVQLSAEGQIHMLWIKHAEQDDEGDYICVAKNSAGIDKWVAEVLVEGKGIFMLATRRYKCKRKNKQYSLRF